MNKSHEMMSSILQVATKSLSEVERSSGEKTSKLLQKSFSVLKRFARKLEEIEGVEAAPPAVLADLDTQLENYGEICERRFHRDIRSWEDRAVQREDAKIALHTIKMHCEKYVDPVKSSLPGVPNYRYQVGETVKVLSSGLTGKVVTVEKENGTGKQVYWVRMVNKEVPKKYFTREIERYKK